MRTKVVKINECLEENLFIYEQVKIQPSQKCEEVAILYLFAYKAKKH